MRAVTPVLPEVALSDAKVLAQRAADMLLPGTQFVHAQLYRGLENEPKVWAVEFHHLESDEPITVIAAATRSLPPIVMTWRGIGGTSPKPILIRAIGPTLTTFGVGSAMADPVVALFRGSTLLQSNDNWNASANQAQIIEKSALAGAFALGATSLDAVILTTLQPGSYTAQVGSAVSGGTGVALVEVYDVDASSDADATGRRLINLSTRAQVGTGGNIMIAGIVVNGPSSRRVLVRGIGPALAGFNVAGALLDPQLSVLNGNSVVATNDDWATPSAAGDIAAAAVRVGAFPLTPGSFDAALLLTLAPGNYTVQLSGVSNTTGVALIEVYEDP